MKKQTSNLVKDLLTENRFWTFWSSDWSKKLNVRWEGSIKFSDVLQTMKMKLGEGIMYERSIEIQTPDIKFL